MTSALQRRLRQRKRAEQQKRRERLDPPLKIQDASVPFVPNAGVRLNTFKKGTSLLVKTPGGGYRPL